MRLFLALVLCTFAIESHASLLIEPYGGYSLGTLSATPDSGTETNSSINGFTYGARGGFVFRHFVILAYEYQALSATQKTSGSADMNWTQGTQYVTLGFQAPNGLRLLGSYGFALNADVNTTPYDTKYNGSAYKLTVGYRFLRDVAINAEYAIYNLNNSTQNGVSSKISDNYSKFSDSAVMFNISIPLTFFNSSGGGGRSRP